MPPRLPVPAGPPQAALQSRQGTGRPPAIIIEGEWRGSCVDPPQPCLPLPALPSPPDRAAFARACRAYDRRTRAAGPVTGPGIETGPV